MLTLVRVSWLQNDAGEWYSKVAVEQTWVTVEGWALPQLPPLISDILISLDDKWLYFSNWLRGDLVQYDISDPLNPKFASRIWLGGSIRKGGPVKVGFLEVFHCGSMVMEFIGAEIWVDFWILARF